MNVWKDLGHDEVINGVEKAAGLALSNIFLRRNSYINRVYELEEDESRERLIVKFYRPGRWTREMILEEHKFLHDLVGKDISVIPFLEFGGETLFEIGGMHCGIMKKKGGRALDEFNEETWQELGRTLARIHLLGELHKNAERIAWKPNAATAAHVMVLEESDYLLPEFKESFSREANLFIEKASPLFSEAESILIHGDCHKGNMLHRPNEGVFIVDFDDICIGPPVQDLWMLLPDEPEKCGRELELFFKGYETFRRFDMSSLELIPYLRGMRVIHYAAWLSIQFKEPDFLTHFPHAGTKRYWSELIRDLQSIRTPEGPS